MMSTVQFGIEAIDGDVIVAAGHLVDPPAMVPNPVNIVRASRVPSDNTSGRWVNGFSFVPEGIGEIGIDDSCSGEHVDKAGVTAFTSDWMPYILSARYECSTFASSGVDFAGRAQRLLEAATPKLLETEFWGGPLSQQADLDNPYLANFTGTAFTATGIEDAVGQLEDALGDCAYGGRGMIHCPPYAASFLHHAGVRREGNLLLTNRDTIIVPGSGYAEFHSSGGSFDMYATGLTDVRLGDVIINDRESFDRSQNLMTIRAYRYGCVSWDELCHAKVTVTLA